MERSKRVAAHYSLFGLPRLRPGFVDRRDDRVELRIDVVDLLEVGIEHLDGRNAPGAYHLGERGSVHIAEVFTHGISVAPRGGAALKQPEVSEGCAARHQTIAPTPITRNIGGKRRG